MDSLPIASPQTSYKLSPTALGFGMALRGCLKFGTMPLLFFAVHSFVACSPAPKKPDVALSVERQPKRSKSLQELKQERRRKLEDLGINEESEEDDI